MSTPFIGEIRLFGGNFAPVGWSFCDGSLLPIAVYDTLFNLIGTTYGGDGVNTFALPDLRGRVPVHQGTGPSGASRVIGQVGGSEAVTLTAGQVPAHTHALRASTATANQGLAGNALLAATGAVGSYGSGPPTASMAGSAVGASSTSAALPHENMAPFGVISYIIALEGIYPSPS